MLLSAAALGCACRRLWRENGEPLFDRLVIDTSFGLGIVSLVLFVLGAMQLYRFKWLVVIAGLFGLVFAPKLVRQAHECWPRENAGRWRWIAALPLVILAIAALIPAMAPPAMDDWDSLAYHLAVPKLYLQHGGIYYINFTTHSNFPFLIEMLYLPGLALNDPVSAKLMNFWTAVLLVGAVYVLARRHLAPKSGPLAALALAGMPIVLWEATTAYVDLATALFTVLAAYMLLGYLDAPSPQPSFDVAQDASLARGEGAGSTVNLIGCGIAAGLAASTKMTGLAVLPLLALWLLIARYADGKKLEIRQAAALIGVGLLVCAPWYIKSIIYTGNPVYPFFYSIFGGRDWNAGLAATYSMLQSKFGLGHGIASFLALPYNLMVKSQAFYDRPGLFVGPIFLVGVVVMLLMIQSRTRKMVGLLGFFLAQVVIWFLLSQQSRYLIPAAGILAALIAGIAYNDKKLTVLRPALWITFGLTAIFGITTLVPAIQSRIAVAIGAESRSSYLSRTLDIYRAQIWMNKHLPRGAKVAFYGDTRGFYLNRAYVWADPSHNVEFTRDFGSLNDLIGYLKSKGVTNLMINFGIFSRPENATGVAAQLYQAMALGRLRPVYPQIGDLRGAWVFELH